MKHQYETFDTYETIDTVAQIRWILPTSTEVFIKRLYTLINRTGPIKTNRGSIGFRLIQSHANGRIEVKGDWFRGGELQQTAQDVFMADLTISELETNRIEVTFQGGLLPPNYAAYRERLAAMIDADYPGTRTRETSTSGRLNIGGDVVQRDKLESAGGHVIHAGQGATVIVIDGNVTLPPSNSNRQETMSLQQQLADARECLRLIEERKAQYVQEVDIPLQLVKEERRLKERVAVLEKELSLQ